VFKVQKYQEAFAEAEELYKQGISLRQIGNILGINRKQVSKYLKSRNYIIAAKTGNSGYDKFEVFEEAELLFRYGMSLRKISAKLFIDRGSLATWLRQKGYIINTTQESINDEERLNRIEILYNSGMSVYEIASTMRIRRGTIADYLRMRGYNTHKDARKYIVNEDSFETIDTEEKAYWLGFLYADGYVSEQPTPYIELALKEGDYRHLVKFTEFLQSDVPIKRKEISINNKVAVAFRVIVNSRKMVNDLISNGCNNCKSLTLEFPGVDILPHHLVDHFVRGYFDGDGSITFSKSQCCISIISTKNFLGKIIEMYNLPTNKYYREGNAFSIKYGGSKISYSFLSKIYDNASIYLDRKHKRYKAFYNARESGTPFTYIKYVDNHDIV
jgi:phage antirepressor YoqD-like protein